MTSRTKLKTSDKPTSPRKTSIARLVPSTEQNIDDDAEDRARGGVQSLGRAFSILEEVARHREGIGLAELSKLVGLHNSTTFHLAKTMVTLGYMRQERDSKRYRVGRPLFALAASALDEIEMVNLATPILEDLSRGKRRKRPFRGAYGRFRRRHCPYQRGRRVSIDRPRRRGAPGALYGPGQDHPGLASPRPAEALPRTGRPEAFDQEVDHRTVRAAAAKLPRSAAVRSPSTTANSTPRCAASLCPSTTLPAR